MLRSKGSADRFARHLRYVEPLDCCCMSGKDARCNKRGYPSQGCFSFSWSCRGPDDARPCEVQAIVPRTRAVDTSAHGSLSEGLGPGTRWDLIACHRDVERSRQRRHSGAVDTGSQAALFIACALASAEHVYAGGVRSLDHGIITNFAASWRNEKMYPVARLGFATSDQQRGKAHVDQYQETAICSCRRLIHRRSFTCLQRAGPISTRKCSVERSAHRRWSSVA